MAKILLVLTAPQLKALRALDADAFDPAKCDPRTLDGLRKAGWIAGLNGATRVTDKGRAVLSLMTEPPRPRRRARKRSFIARLLFTPLF